MAPWEVKSLGLYALGLPSSVFMDTRLGNLLIVSGHIKFMAKGSLEVFRSPMYPRMRVCFRHTGGDIRKFMEYGIKR